jgi:hypothetical protein
MPVSAPSKTESLEQVFDELYRLLSHYSPPLKTKSGTVRGKKDFHLAIPKAVVVPGAYQGKPVEVDLAVIILQRGYVGFYFMPIYMEPALKEKLSPSFTKLLQGKTCFHIKQLDADLLQQIKSALEEGIRNYKTRGWL